MKKHLIQLVLWSQISIPFEKWKEDKYGNESDRFWIITINDKEIVWYNDIEENFNIITFSICTKIVNYEAEPDELQSTVGKLNDTIKNP